jgi:hypothetical protein
MTLDKHSFAGATIDLGADAYTSHGRGSGRLEGSEVYLFTIL